MEGLEGAAKKMKEGEKCRLEIKASKAYGADGKSEFNIPPNADLIYDVEMISFEKVREIDQIKIVLLVYYH